MFKRIVSVVLASLLLVTTLAACNQGGNSTQGSGEVAKAGQLRFLDVSPSPARQAYFEGLFKKFEEESGVKVIYESVPWDDAANRLTVMGGSNKLPDVINVWPGWVGQFAPAGWIIPLDKYLDPTKDTYTEAAQLLMQQDESLYGHNYIVPDGIMVKGIFVRKDWAEEVGVTLGDSWTYDEYFDLVAKLTDKDKKRYGASFRGARGAFDPLQIYLQSMHGGDLYSDDGTILIDDEKSIEGYKKWNDIYLKGYAPQDSLNWGFVEMVDNFTGGLTGTLINDSEVAKTCMERMKPEQWTVMPMPTSEDGKIYNMFGTSYAYSISKSCSDPDTAWKLIEFMAKPENNIEYCKMNGLIPVQKDVANDPTYGEDGPYAPFVKQLNNPNIARPADVGPFDFTDMHQQMMHEEMQKYLLGQVSAEEALKTVTAELEKRMKAYLLEHPDAKVDHAKILEKK